MGKEFDCVCGNMYVLMYDNTVKKIKDLKKGEFIYSVHRHQQAQGQGCKDNLKGREASYLQSQPSVAYKFRMDVFL